jgi:hypothetical protein
MRRSLGAALAALVGVSLLGGWGSAAAQEGPALAVRQVDATDPEAVQVTFTYAGDRDDLSDLVVREGGDLVDTSTAVPLADQQSLGIVLVIDASRSMQDGALIERVLEAARTFVNGKAASDPIAIVTFARPGSSRTSRPTRPRSSPPSMTSPWATTPPSTTGSSGRLRCSRNRSSSPT